MENKQKLQKLLLAEQDDLQKVLALPIPDFEVGRELGNLIKGGFGLVRFSDFFKCQKTWNKRGTLL